MSKVQTTKIKGGADYAKVADRLNEFRSSNPRSKISVKFSYNEQGDLTHHAYIWRDKTDFYDLLKSGVNAKDALESADAEGSSLMYAAKVKAEKGFEKNETIAIGRALAILGYASSGEVASSEEMEEFEEFKSNKVAELKELASSSLRGAKDIADLQKIWLSLDKNLMLDKEIQDIKNEMKEKLK